MTLTRVDIDLTEHQIRQRLAADATRGLLAPRKVLPPKYFYDHRGSDLFEQITRLSEYYPTRLEHRILTDHADEIVAATRPLTSLVELGSGSSVKTPLLLDAIYRKHGVASYVPVDVSLHALVSAVEDLRERYPLLPIHGVVSDFERPLDLLPDHGPRLLALLGGTIGNLAPECRAQFLSNLAGTLTPGEGLLLGVDLVKDRDRLVRAYDDAAGITRQFNRNMLNVLNRLLDGEFEPDRFDHVALWSEEDSWIEMRLRATEAMKVRLGVLDTTIAFEVGEEMRTEISTKFRRETLEPEFNEAGFQVAGWWAARDESTPDEPIPDEPTGAADGDYAVVLGVRS